MHEVLMAIHTSFLVTRPWIDDRFMGQHGATLFRDIKNITMAFLTLFVLKTGIGLLPILFVIIFIHDKMTNQVLKTMKGLGVKEFIGILRGGKVAIHAICHKTLGVIGMS